MSKKSPYKLILKLMSLKWVWIPQVFSIKDRLKSDRHFDSSPYDRFLIVTYLKIPHKRSYSYKSQEKLYRQVGIGKILGYRDRWERSRQAFSRENNFLKLNLLQGGNLMNSRVPISSWRFHWFSNITFPLPEGLLGSLSSISAG